METEPAEKYLIPDRPVKIYRHCAEYLLYL